MRRLTDEDKKARSREGESVGESEMDEQSKGDSHNAQGRNNNYNPIIIIDNETMKKSATHHTHTAMPLCYTSH